MQWHVEICGGRYPPTRIWQPGNSGGGEAPGAEESAHLRTAPLRQWKSSALAPVAVGENLLLSPPPPGLERERREEEEEMD
jgi:hypothetical protein